MNPNKWGPGTWDYFHCVTFSYPKEPSASDKNRFKTFFNNIILPCCICHDSYHYFIGQFKIDNYLDDTNGIVFWLYTLHNMVNAKLNKKIVKFTEVANKYGKMKVDYNKKEINEFINETLDKYKQITIDRLTEIFKSNRNNENIKKVTSNK